MSRTKSPFVTVMTHGSKPRYSTVLFRSDAMVTRHAPSMAWPIGILSRVTGPSWPIGPHTENVTLLLSQMAVISKFQLRSISNYYLDKNGAVRAERVRICSQSSCAGGQGTIRMKWRDGQT